MKAVKILLVVLGAVVALIAIAFVVVAAFFDPNDYKGVVTDAFTARTGRSLTIDRDLKLSYFPWLAVETGGITIGNAQGFGDAPFATIESAAARVKLLPLLSKRFEVGTVELDGLTLNLARDKQLRGNWQDLLDANAAPPDAAAVGPDSGGVSAEGFELEGVKIRKSTVLWRENTSELRYTVANLEVTTGSIGRDEPVDFDLGFAVHDEVSKLAADIKVKATAAVGANGTVAAKNLDATATVKTAADAKPRELHATATSVVFDRNAQTLRAEGLATDTAGVHASWTVAGSKLLDNPTVAGTVSVQDVPLAKVFGELEIKPPQGVAAGDLGNLTLSSEFAFQSAPRKISVSKLSADALGLKVTGDGALDDKDELTGNVTIPEFTPGPAMRGLLRSSVPPSVDVSALDKLALSAHYDTNLGTGRASLSNLKATAFGASLTGNLEAVPGKGGNVYRGSVATSRFAPDAFAKAFHSLLPPTLNAKELGTIRVNAKFALDTAADAVTVDTFEAEMFGLAASGAVTGRGVTKTATWTGHAAVAQFSPQDLMRRFGLAAQPMSDPKALTRATVDMRFDVDAKQARLTDVVLALDDSKIAGDFSLIGFDKPAYKFSLAVDRVDADRYLPPKAKDAKKGEATAGDIKLPENNTMQLDGTMRVGDLRLAGMQFNDVSSRILLGNGDAKLEGAHARLYGGEFNGNFLVHAAGDTPGLALDGKATGLQLQPLIQALTAQPANFSGTGNFQLGLAGKGRTVIENVQTAGGNVAFEMSNGAIKGFNLGRTLCAAYNLTQGAPGPGGEQPKETAYVAIKGSAVVKSGTAQSNDLLARTSFMDVNAHGTLALVDQKLDYDADAKLTGKIAIPNCQTMQSLIGQSIPFTIHGTVTDPAIKPDFGKLLKSKARDELKDRLLRGILK